MRHRFALLHTFILAAGGFSLLFPPCTAAPSAQRTSLDMTSIHAQFAAKDAEIARLRQQVADQGLKLALAAAQLNQNAATLAQKDVAIADLRAKSVNLPGYQPTPITPPAAVKLLPPPDMPPARPGKRWDTEFKFTGIRIGGAGPDMYYWPGSDQGEEHKESRPMPEGSTAEDYAKAFESICKGTGVAAQRVGANVFVEGGMAGYSPDSMTVKSLDP